MIYFMGVKSFVEWLGLKAFEIGAVDSHKAIVVTVTIEPFIPDNLCNK
jgi:hypothetical protein